MSEKYEGKKLCRGSWVLGTACRKCARCLDTHPYKGDDRLETLQNDLATVRAENEKLTKQLSKATETLRKVYTLCMEADLYEIESLTKPYSKEIEKDE